MGCGGGDIGCRVSCGGGGGGSSGIIGTAGSYRETYVELGLSDMRGREGKETGPSAGPVPRIFFCMAKASKAFSAIRSCCAAFSASF